MADSWQYEIDAAVDGRYDEMVALRRHLHAHPEPSNEEYQTSLHIYQLASKIDLPVRMGPEGRGVIVDSRSETTDERMAVRADIDALRIHDEKRVSYRSQTEGVMHACGHDAHTATVFGALWSLDQLEREGKLPWPVTWRGIFQPAEETSTGAQDMVNAGVLEGVGAVLALHVDPSRPSGTIGVRAGVFTASCDTMRIVVQGRGGHGARPHESKDPIAAAAQLISTLYQFLPRATDSQEAVVLTFGQIRGGENPNVIPECVDLHGTLRTLDADVRARTVQHMETLASGIEEISGTKIELHFEASIPSVYNDPRLTNLVSQVSDGLVGAEGLEVMPRPSMGSEDFAAYLTHVPGAMFRLGCAVHQGQVPGLHTPVFDVDERCLAIGAKILARAVIEWSKPGDLQVQMSGRHNARHNG